MGNSTVSESIWFETQDDGVVGDFEIVGSGYEVISYDGTPDFPREQASASDLGIEAELSTFDSIVEYYQNT